MIPRPAGSTRTLVVGSDQGLGSRSVLRLIEEILWPSQRQPGTAAFASAGGAMSTSRAPGGGCPDATPCIRSQSGGLRRFRSCLPDSVQQADIAGHGRTGRAIGPSGGRSGADNGGRRLQGVHERTSSSRGIVGGRDPRARGMSTRRGTGQCAASARAARSPISFDMTSA